MKSATVLCALLMLGLAGTSSAVVPRPTPGVDPIDPAVWEIGPVIGTRNYSVNMPLRPSPHPSGGWYFDIPYPNAEAGHVHYLTFRHGSLSGKSRIVLRYRLEMDEGVRLVPAKEPATTDYQPMLTMYFQRRGDNWSGTGKFEAYRWWATFATVTPIPRALPTGEHELSVPLDGRWTSGADVDRGQQSAGLSRGPPRRRAGRLHLRRRGWLWPWSLCDRPGALCRDLFRGHGGQQLRRSIGALTADCLAKTGCPARIRTSIDGFRVRSLTIRRRGKE